MQDAHRVIYAQAGRPCPRCGEPIRSRGQGDDNRITYWCAGCQAMRRVGHKGADHIAPGNTFASLRGRAARGRRHDRVRRPRRARRRQRRAAARPRRRGRRGTRTPHTLDEGLEHFAEAAYDGVDLIVDLKAQGYEERVADAIAPPRPGRPRSIVSTMEEPSLKLLRAAHPRVRLGWSVPRLRRDPLRNPLVRGPAFVLMHYMRQALPSVAANRIRARRDRRADGALAAGDAAPGARDPRRRRRALRVDRRRRRADRPA